MDVDITLTGNDELGLEVEFTLKGLDSSLTLDDIHQKAIEYVTERLSKSTIHVTYNPERGDC